jgi:tRNA G18 (ribose-2'-O)-methylase SpoU
MSGEITHMRCMTVSNGIRGPKAYREGQRQQGFWTWITHHANSEKLEHLPV